MQLSKRILTVTTPFGVLLGLFEAYRLAGGMVIVMAAMVGLLTVAASSVVLTIRREQRAERERLAAAAPAHPGRTP
ncbi:MAG TPA: hypothetical protein VL994_11615 [Steroidobacteraceae bacterium]|nr:hypothetical protein [Steroidobacteraceae bacterium]